VKHLGVSWKAERLLENLTETMEAYQATKTCLEHASPDTISNLQNSIQHLENAFGDAAYASVQKSGRYTYFSA
jgi:hypothetical protein